MPAHRAASQPDPLSAHLPAIVLAVMALAVCIILLGAHVTEMAGLASYSDGVPTVTQTPDDPAAALPGELLLWMVHTYNLLPWWGWLAIMAGLVAGGSAWTALAQRSSR